MKKSNRVILATVFLAAIVTASAKAQEINTHSDLQNAGDSAANAGKGNSVPQYQERQHIRTHHGLFSFFGRHHRSHPNNVAHTSQHPAGQTHTPPRTNGFGVTMHKSSSAHS